MSTALVVAIGLSVFNGTKVVLYFLILELSDVSEFCEYPVTGKKNAVDIPSTEYLINVFPYIMVKMLYLFVHFAVSNFHSALFLQGCGRGHPANFLSERCLFSDIDSSHDSSVIYKFINYL